MSQDPGAEQGKSGGCGQVVLYVILVFWILLTTIVTQFSTWLVEQLIFEGSLPIPDFRWALILGYGILNLIPALVLHNFSREIYRKDLFRCWAMAVFFVICTAPLRIFGVTDTQMVQLLYAFIGILFILIFIIARPLTFSAILTAIKSHTRMGLWFALFLAAITGIPWILWGALGSLLDIIIGVVVGLSFGIITSLLLFEFGFSPADPPRNMYSMGKLSLVIFLLILILSTSLGQNGNQWLLILTLPFLAILYSFIFLLDFQGININNRISAGLFLGISATWPFIFIDPDELNLVTSVGSGELISWAITIGALNTGIVILASLILFFLRHRIQKINRFPGVVRFIPQFTWVSLLLIYLLWGQKGFHGERLFVILENQLDVNSAQAIDDTQERRAYVYGQLVNHAEQSQKGLREIFDKYQIRYTSYYLVNAFEVQGGPLMRKWLEGRSDVDRVLDSPILRPLPAEIPESSGSAVRPESLLWNLELIQADKVWELEIFGQGIVVGQSDSGVQGDHQELVENYRGRNNGDAYSWYDPWFQTKKPADIGGHGTHTLGTILGKNTGIAPESEWIGCVNLARNLGNPALYLDCMQFMLAPFPPDGDPFADGKPDLGAHVINNSWGCPEVEGCDYLALIEATEALRAAGIFVVASAGNSGESGCGTVRDPIAIFDSVYTVGAISGLGELATFSSKGPVIVDESNRIKPDILAPGVNVLSAYPNNTYQISSGTSMAGPHVSGVVALMWSANPLLIGRIDETEDILNRTASPFEGVYPGCIEWQDVPNNASGYGVLNAYNAVEEALRFGQ